MESEVPVSWRFIAVATLVCAAVSYVALADVWMGLWRSYAVDAQPIQEQILGRRQMVAGFAAFLCVLFAFVFAPKCRIAGDEPGQQYAWIGRAGVTVVFMLIALTHVIEARQLDGW